MAEVQQLKAELCMNGPKIITTSMKNRKPPKKEKGKKPATTKKTEAPAKKVTEIKKDVQKTKNDSEASEKPAKKDAASKKQKTEKTGTKSSGLNGQMSLFDLL